MKNYQWLIYLVPQLAIVPLVYMGTVESSKSISMEFWISPIMLYLLYVCLNKIQQSKSKAELQKVERTIYSGFFTYVMLSVYVGMKLFQHPTFMDQKGWMILFIGLQLTQYILLAIQYQKMRKIS